MGRNTSFGYAQALLSGLLVCPEAAHSFWVPQGALDCTSSLITAATRCLRFLCIHRDEPYFLTNQSSCNLFRTIIPPSFFCCRVTVC
jgi:hypothetical protein